MLRCDVWEDMAVAVKGNSAWLWRPGQKILEGRKILEVGKHHEGYGLCKKVDGKVYDA